MGEDTMSFLCSTNYTLILMKTTSIFDLQVAEAMGVIHWLLICL